MTEKIMDRVEFWVTALGAVAAICAAYTQLDSVLLESADAALVGATASAALAFPAALASIFLGIRHHAGGFVLRFTTAFMTMVSFWFVSGIGQVLALISAISLLLGACLLVMRHLRTTEAHGTSRM